MKKHIIFFIFVLFTFQTLAIAASGPLDALKAPLDEGISLLRDPKYKEPENRQLQRDKIWEIIERVFDFKAISRRALARNWKSFSKVQQDEFVEVFGELLGNTYLDKIQGEYQNEEIVYESEAMLSPTKAVAKTFIIRETLKIPVDYSMFLKDGTWKIYDIKVEGVSLVKNYRSQFSKILFKDSPKGLIKKLKKKVKGIREGNATK